jgi:hypothetical protein
MPFSSTTPLYPTSYPVFAGAPNTGAAVLNNASGTAVSAAVLTGGQYGTRITQVDVHTGPTTAPGSGKLVVLSDDGTTQVVKGIITLNNTLDSYQGSLRFDNWVLKAGHTVKLQMRTAITTGGTVHVSVDGQDLQVGP